MFKKGNNSEYICYCYEITEEDVKDTVINKKISYIPEVIKTIAGEFNPDCNNKHPEKHSCVLEMSVAINKALAKR